MVYLDDLKYMKLYKKKFYLPINMSDKKHGSAILLLTPNYESSSALMNNQFAVNRNRSFECYYVEKDILYTINHETRHLECDHYDASIVPINEQTVFTEVTDNTCFDNLNEMDRKELERRKIIDNKRKGIKVQINKKITHEQSENVILNGLNKSINNKSNLNPSYFGQINFKIIKHFFNSKNELIELNKILKKKKKKKKKN